MKVGISVHRNVGAPDYKQLKSFGFDYYDFDMSNTEKEPYIYNDDDFEKYLAREKKLADEAGINIFQVHGPWRFPPRDENDVDIAERFEKMKRSILGCKILSAKYWVVHPIMPYGIEDIKINKIAETRARNIDFMHRLLKVAKQENVTICLENMPFLDFSLSSPSAIAEFVKEIDDPNFAMCLDTGHANLCSDWHDPAAALRAYSGLIKVLHVHDNRGKYDDHTAPYFGVIDWSDFSMAFREVRFDGVLSLECEPDEKMPKELRHHMFKIYSMIARSILTS